MEIIEVKKRTNKRTEKNVNIEMKYTKWFNGRSFIVAFGRTRNKTRPKYKKKTARRERNKKRKGG